MINDKVQVVILAAGLGKRLGKSEPKVLSKLHGKPLVSYVLEDLEKIQHHHRPILVVGYKANEVKDIIGVNYHYVHQEEQLGTGHAVAVTKGYVDAPYTMVLYGDMPFIGRKGFIGELISFHLRSLSKITMATVTVSDFTNYLSSLQDYGRIVRHKDSGHVLSVVEKKDLKELEQNILELNPGLYIFETKWLFANIDKLKNINSQQEYYLTDMIALAIEQGHTIQTVLMPPEQALGINTPEQLGIAEHAIMNLLKESN